MADSNAAIYKKQTYKYVAPTPPSDLIDSTAFILDFNDRKFVNIGLNPKEKFDVAVHIITPSRYISTSPENLNKIFTLMGTILSFTLETPDKTKNIIFFVNETFKLSNMVYRGENVLVIESFTVDGCRVLLNNKDLMALQSIEWCICEAILRKSSIIRPIILQQVEQMGTYMINRNNIDKNSVIKENLINTVKTTVSDEEFIENMPKCEHCYMSQIKTYAAEQVVEKWSSLMEESIGVNKTNLLI